MTDLTEQPTSLYRFYDADGQLLYVGITARGRGRWYQHQNDKEWWPLVGHAEVDHYEDRPTALAAERALIETEHPAYNVQHNTSRRTTGERLFTIKCRVCGLPIQDGGGYIECWDSDVEHAQQVAEVDRAKTAETGQLRFYTIGELIELGESLAPWRALHRACDPMPENGSYWFDVARIRTWPEVMDWTLHLMEKNWLEHTNWPDFVRFNFLNPGIS